MAPEIKFGEEMRQHFALDNENDIAFCNHGSYGAVPNVVLEKRISLLREVESFPDRFFRGKGEEMYFDNLQRTARFLKSKPENVVFVPNPTYGVNAVLRSMKFNAGDVILCTRHTYNAVNKTLEFIREVTASAVEIWPLDVKLPLESEDEIVQIFTKSCEQKKVKIAIIDHITSCSAMLYPVKKIVENLKKLGVLTLIDGAHAAGHAPDLNLEELGADFYTGTLHKWCYATKGTAYLWVDPKHQHWVRPLIISHNYGQGFQKEFCKQGTNDTTAYLCMNTALDFYEGTCGGREAIAAYVTRLLDFAERLFCESFGVKPMPVAPELRAPYMRIVEMPPTPLLAEGKINLQIVDNLVADLVANDKLVLCITCFDGKAWVRLSGNVYNTREDYIRLRDGLARALKVEIQSEK